MFEHLINEMEKLGTTHAFSIQVTLDDKGYYDRVCPGAQCGGEFKVFFDDWRDKVRDEDVFCPFCRHVAVSTEWNTPAQERQIQEAAQAEAARLFGAAMKRGVERTGTVRMGGGMFPMSISLKYNPGRIPPVILAAASNALRQEFVCEKCSCKYASLGASFFCPACGHNSVTSTFDTTLETVEKTVAFLPALRASLESIAEPDTAKNAARQLLEDQFPRLVGAFERLSEALFARLPNVASHPYKGNVFQRLDDASALWHAATGKSYKDFLKTTEISRLKVLVQRRHVLSHRQGIVDQKYLDHTGDTAYKVGQRLVVDDSDVSELVTLLRKLTFGLRAIVPT
jgi:hypothetical protein